MRRAPLRAPDATPASTRASAVSQPRPAVRSPIHSRARARVQGGAAQRPLAGPDLVVRRKGIQYAVEIESAPEGRGDRFVPLLAQAALQAAHAASQRAVPLAVVAAPRVSRRAAEQVMAFAQRYAPDVAAGVIDFQGFAMFRGPHLEEHGDVLQVWVDVAAHPSRGREHAELIHQRVLHRLIEGGL
jgi:hypothetical protein